MRMPTRRRRKPEQGLHLVVAEFLNMALPQEAVWFHTPNGGTRDVAEAAMLKRLGTLAGIPDIIIIHSAAAYGIELKDTGVDLSPAQKKTHPRLRAAGMKVIVCRSLESVQAALQDWGFELRARVFEWSK